MSAVRLFRSCSISETVQGYKLGNCIYFHAFILNWMFPLKFGTYHLFSFSTPHKGHLTLQRAPLLFGSISSVCNVSLVFFFFLLDIQCMPCRKATQQHFSDLYHYTTSSGGQWLHILRACGPYRFFFLRGKLILSPSPIISPQITQEKAMCT